MPPILSKIEATLATARWKRFVEPLSSCLMTFAFLWMMIAGAAFLGDKTIPSLRRGCEELLKFHSVKTGQALSDTAVRACQVLWHQERPWLIMEFILVTFGPAVLAICLGVYLLKKSNSLR